MKTLHTSSLSRITHFLTYTAVIDMVKELVSICNATSCLKAYIVYRNKLPKTHAKKYQKTVATAVEH